MKPVVIRKEIEAFVGDRLLEAVWREALWLIKDGICTVEELDDVMRYSASACAGRRWACSRPIASPAARPACATSWPSSAPASPGRGPS